MIFKIDILGKKINFENIIKYGFGCVSM